MIWRQRRVWCLVNLSQARSGKRVQLEPTPMRVAGRELVVIRLKPAPSSNGTGPNARSDDKAKEDAPTSASETEPRPETMASG